MTGLAGLLNSEVGLAGFLNFVVGLEEVLDSCFFEGRNLVKRHRHFVSSLLFSSFRCQSAPKYVFSGQAFSPFL